MLKINTITEIKSLELETNEGTYIRYSEQITKNMVRKLTVGL